MMLSLFLASALAADFLGYEGTWVDPWTFDTDNLAVPVPDEVYGRGNDVRSERIRRSKAVATAREIRAILADGDTHHVWLHCGPANFIGEIRPCFVRIEKKRKYRLP